MKILIIRTITGVVFVSLVVSVFFLPSWYAYFLFLLFSLTGTFEYQQMLNKKGNDVQKVLPLILIFTLITAAFKEPQMLFVFIAIFLGILMIIVEMFRKKEFPIQNITLALFPAFWIAVPFMMSLFLLETPLKGKHVLLSIFIIIWFYDTLAYCAGSLVGKHRLFERISPKKSWEGAVISFITVSFASASFFYIPWFSFSSFSTIWHWIGFAAVIVVAATFGDLVESFFKRSCDVKDSGNILPGHGGILDRFDSFFFATPVGFVYWYIFVLI
ncbi:MAG: phosphatidate cytidylyltransferase [Bacteroidales bacterium]|jgi:phosphatidate cytidylyltransferase|nr:phosphatidate cytidylyltransferase [Bacteroidales bacterium]